MSGWRLAPGIAPAAAARFANLDTVFVLDAETVSRDSISHTLRVKIDGRRYYVKRYAGLGKKPLRRWLGKPRVQFEWENLRRFADWDIPTPRLVAWGLERKDGRFARGALVTEEISGSSDLAHLARTGDARLRDLAWWRPVAAQVAAIARRLHAHRFCHGDLKWRNLLVDAAGKVYLIDCPSGGFWRPPFLEYRIARDLASLDETARGMLTRTQRLRFYLDYAQKKKLDAADKRRIRRILRIFVDDEETALEPAAALRAAGRHAPTPGLLALDNGSELAVERWLRVLPGKRLTGAGRWSGQVVLAKLFIANRGSERHWLRECRGIELLQARDLPAPRRLASGRLVGGGHYVLSEYLEGARNPAADNEAELARVFEMAGRLHAAGLLQDDVHLGNFVLHGDRLLVVDGDGIRPNDSSDAHLDNLALLFAQLSPAVCASLRDTLLDAYRRGNPQFDIVLPRLATAIEQARAARLADYLDKCVRDCSLFMAARRADRFTSVVRDEAEFLAPLMAEPDAWIERGTALKRGGSATVARVEPGGRKLVIKRNNIKDAGHAVSRAWRPSRAWRSWLAAHRLRFLGIATPRPLALIERRLGPLRGRAWLISEYCAGPNLLEALAPHAGGEAPATIIEAVRRLFAQLAEARISHGDLKASNLILDGGTLNVVDLDALRQHDSAASWRRAWRRDRERFLRNWAGDERLLRQLEAALPPA
ncbi:MAG TPA: lipopolysaccharide kinase InaA family protein [Candidatus Desulfobacillus sp.]|nr:lipopolysaccharide kinase InaA family protein [Candidatus Desulfobacillus sp.]